MPVNISIKGASEETVRLLKARAVRHHRSLQGEMKMILETVAREESLLDPASVFDEVRHLGLRTPVESVDIIRNGRDAR